jgi:O-antigen/teichoic acid export membrane protein
MKSIARNVFSNWAGFLINILIAFFMSPFIVHSLGNVYYGLWVIMMQLSGYLGILELGVRSSVVKYVSEYIAQKDYTALNRLISLAITIYSVVAFISIVTSVFIAAFFDNIFNFPNYSLDVARLVIIIIGINVAIGFIFNVYYGILMGIQRYDIYNKVLIVTTMLKSAAIVGFLFLGYGIVALGIIQIIFSLISNLSIVFFSNRKIPQLNIKLLLNFDVQLFKKVFKYSSISFFVNISQKIIFQTDAFVIGIFLNAIQITYYAIPVTLVEYLRRLVISMTEIFVPMTSELEAKNDRSNILSLLINGTKVSLIIALPICIVFFFNGYDFIRLWMGEEYAQNGNYVLKVLAITHLLSITHLTSREILFGMSLHKFNAICYGCEAIANLILSIILVKYFGIIGVAIGTAIPHIIIVVFVFPIMMSRLLGIRITDYAIQSISSPVMASLPFAAYSAASAYNYHVSSLMEYFAMIGFGMPVYGVCIYFICLKHEERDKIKQVLVKKLSRRHA